MDALIRHQKSAPCTHKTTLVVSNQHGVGGLTKADVHGVDSEIIEVDTSITSAKMRREDHENRIMNVLEKYNIEVVILSGYMRILSPLFVRQWKGRLLNIHPSLLPKYPGAHAHRDALADGASVSGCTVHLVDEGVDTGQILAQREVPVLPEDDEHTLSERIKKIEHVLYPQVIDAFTAGKINSD